MKKLTLGIIIGLLSSSALAWAVEAKFPNILNVIVSLLVRVLQELRIAGNCCDE